MEMYKENTIVVIGGLAIFIIYRSILAKTFKSFVLLYLTLCALLLVVIALLLGGYFS